MTVTEQFGIKTVEFDLECDTEFGNPCSACGFVYMEYKGNTGNGCNQTQYHHVYFGSEENKYVVYEKTEHSTYGYTSNTQSEDIIENGVVVGEKNTEIYSCGNCRKPMYKFVTETRKGSEKALSYKYDEQIKDYELAAMTETVYKSGTKVPSSSKNTYYEDGTVYYWQLLEYTYGKTLCEVTVKETDSLAYYKTRSYVSHTKEWKNLPDESGEAIDGNNIVYTEAMEYYCTKCGASFEKCIYKDTYDENDNRIQEVDEYYDSYTISGTEYGYRIRSRATRNYGVHEYKPGKFGRYLLNSTTEYYDENGVFDYSYGANYVYESGNYCEYKAYEVYNGAQNEDFYTGTNHIGEEVSD